VSRAGRARPGARGTARVARRAGRVRVGRGQEPGSHASRLGEGACGGREAAHEQWGPGGEAEERIVSRRLFGLATMWLRLVAATPMPPEPPPPDVISLVPFVSAPLDKPALQIARLAPPPPPIDVPPLPPATVVLPAASKPTAAVPASRVLPCAGAWLRISSESRARTRDRKSTRLNSSHVSISYAVFCLKKKKRTH